MSFTEQEIEEFKAEALELLDSAEKSLLSLDNGSEFRCAFDTVFRGFHNLKGASGMMELHMLQAHTHELENILMRFKGETSIPKEYINLFLRGIDAARSILDGESVQFDFHVKAPAAAPVVMESVAVIVPAAESDIPSSVLEEFVSEADEIIERISKNLQLLESLQFTKESIDALYRDVHSLKGSSYLFSFSNLGDVAHAMESSLEKVRNETHSPNQNLINALYKSVELIESLVLKIKNNQSDSDSIMTVKALIANLNLASDKLVEKSSGTSSPTETAQATKDNEVSSIRVPVALLDSLMTLMGEMVLVRNQVLQYSSKSEDLELLSMSKRLNVVTSEIQGEMMKTRMQPIGNVLNKFNRVVRDISQELTKNISLQLYGIDTELDKSLLEAIKDPLTHIVRNSCDHGIETPEVRRKSGKSDQGIVEIRAYHEGGQVIIDISDNGKGLNKDVLLKKALEKGLLTSATANKLSEKEIFNLIFAPGFSTAAKVTNLSGRGVGMDVVRTNIERIGGTVELSSVTGSGTSIKIKIPLTLAIVPALIVKCGTGTFAIPQVKLEELVRVDQSSTQNKIEFLHGSPVYRLRGNILPLVDLNNILQLHSKNKDSYENKILNIAVLNAEQNSFGIIIDEIQDTADIVVKPLNRLLKSLQVYSGATVLGDGSIALILDVLGMSKVAQINRAKTLNNDNALDSIEAKKQDQEIQDFILLKVNSPTKHALPLVYVNRLEEFKAESIEYSGLQRVIRYRDAILPLVSASEQLGYGKSAAAQAATVLSVIVVEKAGVLYGLEVDQIIDTLKTNIEISTHLNNHPGVFGNINTKDELIVVLNPFELIAKAFPDLHAEVQAQPKLKEVQAVVQTHHNEVKNILLVEDTAFFRKAIKTVLDKAGFNVTIACDGQDAVEFLNRNQTHIDMIVSDIEMPRMNGFVFAEHVRKHPKYRDIPMLAISSRADKDFQSEGKKAGFNVYLEKLKPEILITSVNELISSSKKAA